MKKTILWVFIAIISGALLGKFTFDRYQNLNVEQVIKVNDEVYALKYGSYNNLEEMYDKTKKLERFIFIEKEGKINVYLGLSASRKNMQKVLDIYKSSNMDLKIEKITIANDEFIQNLNEYEKLLEASNDEKSLLIIQNQILSCYDKLVAEYE